MIEHIKMMQILYRDIWSMFPSGQVLHRPIEAIQVACFGISRRPCDKHCPIVARRKITCQLLLIGLSHKLISVQDVEHNMLPLHVVQQASSLKVHAPVSYFLYEWQWCWAEQFPFGIFLKKILPDLLKLRTKAKKPDIQFLQHNDM